MVNQENIIRNESKSLSIRFKFNENGNFTGTKIFIDGKDKI